jgi:hypothetical protein
MNMNRSLFSLVLLFGAVSAGGTAPVPDCTPTECRTVTTTVTTPVATTLRPALRTRVTVATPMRSVAVVATPVACDPELLRARSLARASTDGQCCSPKTKKKAQSSCTTTTREQELAYEEAVTRAAEDAARAGEEAARAGEEAARAGEEAARVHEVRAWANGGGSAELKALHELAQQGHCSQKALAELAAQAHELARAGEHMRALHTDELAVAQAYANSEVAAFERDSHSIAEKVRSALGKLGRKHDESADDSDDAEDESADDEVSWDDDSEEDSDVDYAEVMSDEDDGDDDHDSSLEARIEKLEALARSRGHDVDEDDDDSKSLEERVESLERLMRGGEPGVYNFRMPRMRLEALKNLKEFKAYKDWPRVKIGDNEVFVMPNGNWPVPSAPNAKSPDVWHYPQKDAKPGKAAPKAKAYKWYWPSKDEDGDDDEVDVPEPPEAPEPPEPADVPDVPDVPDAFAPFAHGGGQHGLGHGFAPGASAETRREIESLMREMRSQIDSMRTEMERLREELVRASKRGTR